MAGTKEEVLGWLYGLESRGVNPGLENTTELLRRLGNPQESFAAIHVAGTDGKGSVCAMAYSVLMEAGMRAGMYTSPHILDFNERISVDGEPITDSKLIALAGRVRPHVEAMEKEGMRCTFFEATTAIAYLHFREEGVPAAVIEVGMGGRLDSTNVLRPMVCAIAGIGLEHRDFLGDTLGEIAGEKAGIIKKGVPVVTFGDPAVLPTIAAAADAAGARLVVVDEPANVTLTQEGTDFTYEGERYSVGIPGGCQARNGVLAIETMRAIGNPGIDGAIRRGLAKATLPCRLEKVGGLPLVIDVTHTPSGSASLARDFMGIYGAGNVVLGLLSDKDASAVAANLAPIAGKFYLAAPGTGRAMPVGRLLEEVSKHGEAEAYGSLGEAVEAALAEADGKTVLATGSFHVAEEVIGWLQRTYPGYWTR
ncbi:MAG: bifunctional folylpolyglutamate synthase/dihydrofolate synthase [Thermoplasmatales archaeon]|nr:bifunctional folylpolyglutamate synthase/dihydrofolate synthase [Thermoplasmatales archaeon]